MRFYFHLICDIDVPDEEGFELPDLEAARETAREQARGLIGELMKTDGRIVLSHRVDIEDLSGAVLDTIYFRDVVSIES
ncbi:uncharacterized protein DUF6894 [Sphingomonas sp. F9_3S_D5_B_2]